MKALYSRKLVFILVALDLVLTGILYLGSLVLGYQLVPNWFILALGLIFLVAAIVVYYQGFVRPLDNILDQIQMLLSRRKYKKILMNRVDEIGVLAHFFNQVTESLEFVSEEITQGQRVAGELKVAGQLQKELIPNVAPSIKGLEIAVKSRSAEELGGDNFDFINSKYNSYLYVGDVTGHGVPAAIVMTMVNTLMNAFAEIYDTAYDIVVGTNRQLKKKIRTTMFMTMVFVKWDSLARKMSYVGCGHEHILIYRAKTGLVEAIKTGGIALGMVSDNSKIIKELDLPLETNDVVVLYTDGITEARNMQGEMYGLEGLRREVGKYAGLGDCQTMLQNIAKDFSRFVGDHVQDDDVTLIVIRKLAETEKEKTFMDQKQERWETGKDLVIGDESKDTKVMD